MPLTPVSVCTEHAASQTGRTAAPFPPVRIFCSERDRKTETGRRQREGQREREATTAVRHTYEPYHKVSKTVGEPINHITGNMTGRIQSQRESDLCLSRMMNILGGELMEGPGEHMGFG